MKLIEITWDDKFIELRENIDKFLMEFLWRLPQVASTHVLEFLFAYSRSTNYTINFKLSKRSTTRFICCYVMLGLVDRKQIASLYYGCTKFVQPPQPLISMHVVSAIKSLSIKYFLRIEQIFFFSSACMNHVSQIRGKLFMTLI